MGKTKKPKADSGSDYDGEGDEEKKSLKAKKGKVAKGYTEWESEEEMGDSGSDFEAEKSSRGKRKSIYAENSDSESDEAWAPGKALKPVQGARKPVEKSPVRKPASGRGRGRGRSKAAAANSKKGDDEEEEEEPEE